MPGSFRAGCVLIARELRAVLHDPSALIAIIGAPFVLAIITSVSLGARPKIEASIGVAGNPGVVQQMITEQAQIVPNPADVVVLLKQVPVERAEAMVRDGEVAAVVIVPVRPTDPVRVFGGSNEQIAREVATTIGRTLAANLRHGLIPAVDVKLLSTHESLHGGEVYGPVIAVFFVLFGIGSVSRHLQSERRDGTLSRLLTSPVRPSVVLASKGVMMLLVGLVEVAVVILATTLFFGARWGNPAGVMLVTFVVVVFGITLATAIASITASAAQALALETAAALALIALGGHMVPLRNLPAVATTISRYTPNGAAIDAFGNIASGEGSLGSQLAPLMVTVAFAVAVGTVGLARLRKVLAL